MIQPSPTTTSAAAWLGTWSRPPDRPAQIALALAAGLVLAAVVPGGVGWAASLVEAAGAGDPARRRRFLTIAAFVAAFLSLAYIEIYLRGGPRAFDAPVYWLQGRALAHGSFAWATPDPSASFRARDLLFRAPDRLSGTFPPGYPLLLAAGFLVGAPMLVGPLVAAAIVVATWLLAHEIVADPNGARGPFPASAEAIGRAEGVARLAVGLSIASAALRYHTADALPYGVAATAVALSLSCALRARRTGEVRFFGGAGLCIGFLVSAQPASVLSVGVTVAVLAWGAPERERGRALGWTCAAALPGLVLLLAANRQTTGHVLVQASTAYAALAGAVPPETPLGWSVARSLRDHLLDIANLEPLALVGVVPLLRRSASRRAAVLTALVIVGQVLTMARVRSGEVPGAAGAPLVVLLPLEHALVALGVADLFPRRFPKASLAALGLSLGGFAVHASYTHGAIAARDIGRPRFEPDAVREANVTHGLLFFDDDAGYELAHDPGLNASHGVEAARMRGDDHDRLLYDSLGHPPIRRYVAAGAKASLPVWFPPNAGSETWRFETEAEWPPVRQEGGLAEAVSADNACASDGRVLRVSPTGSGQATAVIALPVPPGSVLGAKRSWMVTPRVFARGTAGKGTLRLSAEGEGPPLAEWTWNDSEHAPACRELAVRAVEFEGTRARAWLVVGAEGGPVAIDRMTLRLR